MGWKIIDSGCKVAGANMAFDAELLEKLENTQEPVLHFYDWSNDSATYGYFIDPDKYLNSNAPGLDLARRPTGGGIVFHTCDLAFSCLVPQSHPSFSLDPLANYAFINQKVGSVIGTFIQQHTNLLQQHPTPLTPESEKFCMAKPTKYDVMLGSKKVGGASQRKTRFGYLHQGSIFLGMHEKDYLKQFLLPRYWSAIDSMDLVSLPLLPNGWTKSDLDDARSTLRVLLKKVFEEQ